MNHEIPMGMRFSLLHRSFRKKMDEMLREKDLTGVQFGVLGALMHMERSGTEEINQKDLEQVTHVTHPTMTEIIKRLEKKELIRCEVSRRDRRYKQISSTEKCHSLQQAAKAVEEETTQWLCRDLSPEQLRQLEEITDVMLRNAFESCGKGCDCP